jgi:hypothetical protein
MKFVVGSNFKSSSFEMVLNRMLDSNLLFNLQISPVFNHASTNPCGR